MRLHVSLVRMPLLSAFSNSRAKVVARHALILELEHKGIRALSECVTDEGLSSTGEDNATALLAMKCVLAPRLKRSVDPEDFLRLTKRVPGNEMAKAALEMLLWDYSAKAKGRPLDRLLGHSRGFAETGISIGLGSEREVRSQVEAALRRRYRRVKVKIERGSAAKRLKGLRDAFPEIPLSADANGCFELRRDLDELKKLDRFELQYIEQPLGSGELREHSQLAKKISTPICLDESITNLESAKEALRIRAAEVFNVKPGRVGGLTMALKIVRFARGRGAHVWVGGMLETGIGRAFNVALAGQSEIDYPGDTSPNDRYFARDLVKNPFEMEDGIMRPNAGPGIGVELDRSALVHFTRRSWKIL